MSIYVSKPETHKTNPAITRDSMRILGEKSANDFLNDVEGCLNPSVAFAAWRADCYAELVEVYEGHVDLVDLLTVWGRAFDSVQPPGLTPKEVELLKAYRMTDDRGRKSIYDKALGQAEDWPRYKFSSPSQANGVAS